MNRIDVLNVRIIKSINIKNKNSGHSGNSKNSVQDIPNSLHTGAGVLTLRCAKAADKCTTGNVICLMGYRSLSSELGFSE